MIRADDAATIAEFRSKKMRAVDAVLVPHAHADDAAWMDESAAALEYLAAAYRIRAAHIRKGLAVSK